jgi:hypothetical protein
MLRSETTTDAPVIIIQPDDLTIKIRDITVPSPAIQKEEKEDNENGQMV